MRRTMPGAVAVFLLAASGTAVAEGLPEGIYLEGRGGATFLQDAENSGGGISIESQFDTGFAAGGAVGYAHSSGFRGEVAVEYRRNNVNDLTITNDGGIGVALGVGSLNGISLGAAGASVDGHASSITAMVNGFYDIDLGSGFAPYIGAGIGVAHVAADVDVSAGGATSTFVDDSDQVLAYQGIAGISYHFTENVAATVHYTYLATSDPELESGGGADFDSEYESHNVMAGLRFTF